MNLSERVAIGFDRYNAHDIEAVMALYHPSAVIASPFYPGGVDLDAHCGSLDAIFTAFGDLHAEAELTAAEAGRVTVQFRVAGTHSGPLRIPDDRSHAPTGRTFSIRGTLVQEFDGAGRIVRERTYWDIPTLLSQLEIELAEPAPAAPGT